MATWWSAVLWEHAGAHRTSRPNGRDQVHNLRVQAEPAAALATWLYRPDDLALPRKARAAATVREWTRPSGMRARSSPRPWTADEDAQVMAYVPVATLAADLDRTLSSVVARRWRLRSGRAG